MEKIGSHLKSVRLKQNITQKELAKATDLSLSSVKKLEKGKFRSFETFIRVIRILGKLEVLQPLVEEMKLSPSEYYDFIYRLAKHRRKRATGTRKKKEVQNDD